MFTFELKCENCCYIGPPSTRGTCAACGSDAIADFVEPDPVRYEEPVILGVERMAS